MKQKNKNKSISKSKFEIIEKICIISFAISITSFFLPNEFVVINYICSAIGIVSVVTYLVTFCIYTRKNFESKYDYFFESNDHIQVQLKKFDIDCQLDNDFLISIIEIKDLSFWATNCFGNVLVEAKQGDVLVSKTELSYEHFFVLFEKK